MNDRQLYQQRVLRRKEKDPTQRILTLMNQYWGIDNMHGTPEEKEWAKSRLRKDIMGIARHLSLGMQGDIKLSLKTRRVWETVRERIA